MTSASNFVRYDAQDEESDEVVESYFQECYFYL